METVQLLAPIAAKACSLEDLDPQSKGEFLRILCCCSELDEDKIQLLFEHILDALSESELLTSCEFHEGLDGILSGRRTTELILGAYPGGSADEIGEVVVNLYSAKLLKPDKETWDLLRTNMSSVEFREMFVRLCEASSDGVGQIAGLLDDVYDTEEDFEIADSIRMILDTHWVMDILPQKRKAAAKLLYEVFGRPFPFAKKVVDDFVEEVLRLDPPVAVEPEQDKKVESSSDSDIESRGSLDDFVVDSEDDDEESGTSSNESELSSSSSSSGESRKKGKKGKKRVGSSSDSSDAKRHRKRKAGKK